MKGRLRGALRNPLVIIPPFVIALVLGWQQYTLAGRSLSLPEPNGNLLNSNSLCEHFGTNNLPDGWQVHQDGSTQYSIQQTGGYATAKSCSVTIRDYQNGALSFTTPSAQINPGTTYLFKTYYRTTTAFTLVMDATDNSGKQTHKVIREYGVTDNSWTTAASAFKPDSTTASVQFTFRAYGNGTLQINSPYVQAQTDVHVTAPLDGPNLIPNANLAATNFNAPDTWSTYQSGRNDAEFGYATDQQGNYVAVTVRNYKDGQAKWQYPEQPVLPGNRYRAEITYRSTVPTAITAEYVLENGSREHHVLGTVQPADDWTTISYTLGIPLHATSALITLPLERTGMVASKQYQLVNITSKDIRAWKNPMVSLAFVDGWASAHDIVLPQLQAFGFAATFYVNPTTIETPGFMTANQLADLHTKDNEIGAHGYEHLDMTTLDASALDFQLRQGRDYLRTAGYTVTSFAPPDGRRDPQVDWHAEQYYATQLGNGDGLNTSQNLDPYNLKALTITPFTDQKTLADALQNARNQNAWLILIYHQVADNPDYGRASVERSAVTPDALREQLTIIKKSGIQVRPIDAAYRALTEH